MRVPILIALSCAAMNGQLKSRELEDLFTADTLKKPATPPAVKKTTPPIRRAPAPKPVAAAPPAGHDPERHSQRRVGVKCRLQLIRNNEVVDADPSSIFKSGDRIRLTVEPNIDGYLYIILQGSSGRESLLFPHADINGGRNEVLSGRMYPIPPAGAFRFDDQPGLERVRVILSRTPLEALPATQAPQANQQLAMNLVNRELDDAVKARDLVFDQLEGPALRSSAPTTQTLLWMNVSDTDNRLVHFELKLEHR